MLKFADGSTQSVECEDVDLSEKIQDCGVQRCKAQAPQNLSMMWTRLIRFSAPATVLHIITLIWPAPASLDIQSPTSMHT